MHGKRILIVGASGVLGGSIGLTLARAGADIVGTARTDDGAAALPQLFADRLVLDLMDPHSIAHAGQLLGDAPLDGIVNAAGAVGFGAAADTDARQAAELMQVNHAGPAELITKLLPTLSASAAAGRSPIIVGITGVVAERAFPGMAAYVASKTAHAAWLAALRMETRRAGIRVLDARPGHTETGLAHRARFGVAPAFPAGMTAEHVAARIVQGMQDNVTVMASTDFA